MTLEAQISLMTVPQEFCRLCNALLVASYGDDFLPIDDDRPDAGNDGYLKPERRMFAMHCFKRSQNQSLDQDVRRKMIGDLGKAVALKSAGLWEIEAWTFIANYPISDEIAREVVTKGAEAGIDVSWRGPAELGVLLQRHPEVRARFPALQTNEVLERLGEIRQQVDKLSDQSHGVEDSYIPVTDAELTRLATSGGDFWEYRLLAGRLLQGKQDLEFKYLDYSLGIVERRVELSFDDAQVAISEAFQRISDAVGTLDAVCQPSAQEYAFGRIGEPGNAHALNHMAGRILATYEEMLDTANEIRAVEPPIILTRMCELVPRYAEGLIEELRDFIARVERAAQQLPKYVDSSNDDEPVTVTLTIDVTLDEAVQREVESEIKRVLWRVRRTRWIGGDLDRRA